MQSPRMVFAVAAVDELLEWKKLVAYNYQKQSVFFYSGFRWHLNFFLELFITDRKQGNEKVISVFQRCNLIAIKSFVSSTHIFR